MLPYEAVFGMKPPDFKPGPPEVITGTIRDYLDAIKIVRRTVQEKLEEAKDTMALAYDEKHRVKQRNFKIGDWVLCNKDAWYTVKEQNWKFYDWFYGPYKVVGIPHPENPTVVELDLDMRELPQRTRRVHRKMTRVINTRHLKLYKYIKDTYAVNMTSTPVTAKEFLKRAGRILGIAYIDLDDKAVGVMFIGAEPGHVCRIPFDWFKQLKAEILYPLVKEFLNAVGSTIENSPTVEKALFGRNFDYELDVLKAPNGVRDAELHYPNGMIAPREPIRRYDIEGNVVDSTDIEVLRSGPRVTASDNSEPGGSQELVHEPKSADPPLLLGDEGLASSVSASSEMEQQEQPSWEARAREADSSRLESSLTGVRWLRPGSRVVLPNARSGGLSLVSSRKARRYRPSPIAMRGKTTRLRGLTTLRTRLAMGYRRRRKRQDP